MLKLTLCCLGLCLLLVACGMQNPNSQSNDESGSENAGLHARLFDSATVRMHTLLEKSAYKPTITLTSYTSHTKSSYAHQLLQESLSDSSLREHIEKASTELARTDISDIARANAEWDLCSARAALVQRAELEPFLTSKDTSVFRYVVKSEVTYQLGQGGNTMYLYFTTELDSAFNMLPQRGMVIQSIARQNL